MAEFVKSAEFVMSNSDIAYLPKPTLPEYAFIGRSNVGKSSLINSLCNNKKLAKTSSKPGKTQLINHFLIDKEWFLVDLPGYGYTRTSVSSKQHWQNFSRRYLRSRESLMCIFLLIDSRHKPQEVDLLFMEWIGTNGLPFVIVFTKADKLKEVELEQNIENYCQELLQSWEELPQIFRTSSVNKQGNEEILQFVKETNKLFEVPKGKNQVRF